MDLMIARVSNLFNLPMSFAFGEGLSIASQNPLMENQKKDLALRMVYLKNRELNQGIF